MAISIKPCEVCGSSLVQRWPSYYCAACQRYYTKEAVSTTYIARNPSRNVNKERSDKHEKKAAKKIDGRGTPASGAMKFNKADVYSDLVRMECKTTLNASYSIKKDLLLKLAGETEMQKVPVFNIQFEDDSGNLNYYILDEGFFLELLELWRKQNEQ